MNSLESVKRIFFYGIGGIGISSIARMMLAQGKEVYGQDITLSDNIEALKNLGAKITIGQSINNIPEGTDLIVYSRAIEVLEPQFLKEIKTLSIPSLVYPEMLGLVTQDTYTIAVSGAHGKTTTTGMIAHALMKLGGDPTVVIGSFLQGTTSNFIQGTSKYFVVEADEYHRAFLNLHPTIAVVLNIDLDHVDYYKDIEDIKNAYREFVNRVPKEGYIVCDIDAPYIKDILQGVNGTVIDVKSFMKKRALMLPGIHNQYDGSMAAAVLSLIGFDQQKIDQALATFPGTWRRFEYKGVTNNNTKVYDDYAHHPSEVRATLEAFRELYPKNTYRLHVFFQPHLFSRTKALLSEFMTCFADADDVVLLPIFKAREIDDGTISSQIVAEKIGKQNIRALTFEETKSYIKNTMYTGKDILITMGAGEAYKVTEEILL